MGKVTLITVATSGDEKDPESGAIGHLYGFRMGRKHGL
jgi:hypothetical protein